MAESYSAGCFTGGSEPSPSRFSRCPASPLPRILPGVRSLLMDRPGGLAQFNCGLRNGSLSTLLSDRLTSGGRRGTSRRSARNSQLARRTGRLVNVPPGYRHRLEAVPAYRDKRRRVCRPGYRAGRCRAHSPPPGTDGQGAVPPARTRQLQTDCGIDRVRAGTCTPPCLATSGSRGQWVKWRGRRWRLVPNDDIHHGVRRAGRTSVSSAGRDSIAPPYTQEPGTTLSFSL